MIVVPRDRAGGNLLVYPLVGNERDVPCPFLKIEQLRKELEGFLFADNLQPDHAAQVRFKDGRGLLKLRDEPVVLVGLFLRLGREWSGQLGLQGEAPMQVDAAKVGRLRKEVQPMIHKGLCDGIGVLLLARHLETGGHAHVLVERKVFRKAAYAAFDASHLGSDFRVREPFFVRSIDFKEQAIAACFAREHGRRDEADNGHDAVRGPGLGEPWISVCAGHSSSSGSSSDPTVGTSLGVCG